MLLDKINFPKDLKKLKVQELPQLASEIRDFLLDNISKTGGHLASNLGVVELTIALHYFFNCPKDKIVWDVGHQCYTHKILTGRKNQFKNLRKRFGISGFPKREESLFDVFSSGHSSTALSATIGIYESLKIKHKILSCNKQKKSKKEVRIVAIIGDGALTGGLALEALNQIGYLGSKVIIILNDNRMSIAENVGALSRYTKRIEQTAIYQKVKKDLSSLIYREKRNTRKKGLSQLNRLFSLKSAFKEVGTPGLLFEKLGINYLGPVDGHHFPAIFKNLKVAERLNGPTLIHLRTKKGMGYEIAEKEAVKFHATSPFSLQTGECLGEKMGLTFSEVFGKTLLNLAKRDRKIVAITAAMTGGTGLNDFANNLGERFFDVGICEQHAVTFAAGLATEGIKPVVAIYSTFLQRAYDQIIHDVCLQKLPIVFAIDRAGIVGEDGPTHHGVFDLSFLLHIPNLTVLAPRSLTELKEMLVFAINFKKGPIAIRYPRGGEPCLEKSIKYFSTLNSDKRLEVLKSEIFFKKTKNFKKNCKTKKIFVTVGTQIKRGLELALKEQGRVVVVNPRCLKPIDEKIFLLIKQSEELIIVEENVKIGGFGSLLLTELSKRKMYPKVQLIGIEDDFIEQGEVEELKRDKVV